MKTRGVWALLILLGCGDDGAPMMMVDAGSPGEDAAVADGGPPDAGDVEMCPAPPADLGELTIVEDGPFRRVDAFPFPGFAARQVTVYLPEGYDPARRYPV